MGKFRDLTGKRFGRWTVLNRVPHNDKDNKVLWHCKCDCGAEREINSGSLLSGNSKSCGCLKNENTSIRVRTHGMSSTRLFHIWQGIRKRCNNPNSATFKHYGGRGISVCEEWERFEPFRDWALASGYSDELTIDRIDVSGNYEPSNCRWATQKTQKNNKRNNHYMSFRGETHTMAEWSEILQIPYSTLNRRKNLGWDDERALTQPVRKTK